MDTVNLQAVQAELATTLEIELRVQQCADQDPFPSDGQIYAKPLRKAHIARLEDQIAFIRTLDPTAAIERLARFMTKDAGKNPDQGVPYEPGEIGRRENTPTHKGGPGWTYPEMPGWMWHNFRRAREIYELIFGELSLEDAARVQLWQDAVLEQAEISVNWNKANIGQRAHIYLHPVNCRHISATDDGDAEGVLWCPDCRTHLPEPKHNV